VKVREHYNTVATLIYLWTRDAKLPVGEETEKYVKQHLDHLKDEKQFSDLQRIEMARRLASNG
jgi:hypothetical protein